MTTRREVFEEIAAKLNDAQWRVDGAEVLVQRHRTKRHLDRNLIAVELVNDADEVLILDVVGRLVKPEPKEGPA